MSAFNLPPAGFPSPVASFPGAAPQGGAPDFSALLGAQGGQAFNQPSPFGAPTQGLPAGFPSTGAGLPQDGGFPQAPGGGQGPDLASLMASLGAPQGGSQAPGFGAPPALGMGLPAGFPPQQPGFPGAGFPQAGGFAPTFGQNLNVTG